MLQLCNGKYTHKCVYVVCTVCVLYPLQLFSPIRDSCAIILELYRTYEGEGMRTQLNFYLPTEEKQALAELARRRYRTLTAEITRLIRQELKAEGLLIVEDVTHRPERPARKAA